MMQTILPKEKDTFSNEGNFSISINHINLKAIEQQSNHCITKDTPIFCYVQENKQNFIAKFKDNQSTIHITLDTTIQKDEDNNIIPIETKNIFLSFIPFKDNQEANNTIAQKLQLTTQDLNKGYKDINFRIPLLYLKDCEMFRGWREEIEEERKKSEIDLRIESGNKQGIKVEWISQFDNGGGTACFDTCKKILVNSGLSSKSASPATRFQIALENKALSQSKNQDEYLIIDTQVAKNGIEYLDLELESGYPVLVGVDYEFDRKIKLRSGKIDYPNKTDYTTDHYIVIVGRKYDNEGDLYYLFYDVGTNFINEKKYRAGSNDNNRLYLKNDYSLRGQSQIPSKHFYVVTQIRKNVR